MTVDASSARSVQKQISLGRLALCLMAALAAPVLAPADTARTAGEQADLIRLTPEQYQRSIRDIFGAGIQVDENQVDRGVRDEGLLALGNRKLTLSAAALERSDVLAQSVASQVTDPRRRATLIGCKPASNEGPDDACARQFITRIALPLFRRPTSSQVIDQLVATQHSAAEKLHSFDAGLSAALVRMLVAPEFLFRVEVATRDPKTPGRLQLDAWSRAARLSYFLWNSTPDAELLAAAKSGSLMKPEGLKRQVQRLLDSPRIEAGMRAFFIDMLGFGGLDEDPGFDTLSIDTSFYPNFTQNAQNDAQEQTLRTIVDELLNKNHDYRDLFVTRNTFLTPMLASLYGVPLARSQELGGAVPWVPYQFSDKDPYVGILTQVSFLSLHSHPGRTSPTRRGKALREIFLCQKVPPPPGNVDFSVVQNTADPRFKTVRQRLLAHRDQATCAGCHKIMDPIGLTFETFNTASEFRTTENGAPIDASGELNGRKFNGVRELAETIKDDPATSSCLIRRAYAYGTQRHTTAEENASLKQLQTELSARGIRWRDLMRSIALDPNFFTNPVDGSRGLGARNAQ